MLNTTAQPPPQLSKDGLWRWDGNRWALTQPKTSKPSYLPGPTEPQVSADGHWWWVDYRWVPADPASPKPPRLPGLTPAKLAVMFGLGTLFMLPLVLFFLMQGTYDTPSGMNDPYSLSEALAVLALPFSGVVFGVVFGVRALVSLRQRDDRSSQRRMAWGGIAASLASAIGVVLIGLAAAAAAAGS